MARPRLFPTPPAGSQSVRGAKVRFSGLKRRRLAHPSISNLCIRLLNREPACTRKLRGGYFRKRGWPVDHFGPRILASFSNLYSRWVLRKLFRSRSRLLLHLAEFHFGLGEWR